MVTRENRGGEEKNNFSLKSHKGQNPVPSCMLGKCIYSELYFQELELAGSKDFIN